MLAYRPGKENYVPDMLSQLPFLAEGPALQDALVACLVRQIRPQGMDLDEVRTQTAQDHFLQSVCHCVQSDWPHKSKAPQSLLPFYHVREELEWSDGVLLRGGASGTAEVAPGQGSSGGTCGPSGHGTNEMEASRILLVARAGHTGRDNGQILPWLPDEQEKSPS